MHFAIMARHLQEPLRRMKCLEPWFRRWCRSDVLKRNPRSARVFLSRQDSALLVVRKRALADRGASWAPNGRPCGTSPLVPGKSRSDQPFLALIQRGVAFATPVMDDPATLMKMSESPECSLSFHHLNGKWFCISKETDDHRATYSFVNYELKLKLKILAHYDEYELHRTYKIRSISLSPV